MTTSPVSAASVVERIRHPLKARHVQLVERRQISPGFVRVTLAGPQLEGFVSAGFDDHVKFILPQAGQERPGLPTMVDGRPVFDGERPTMRDYTPLHFDAQRLTLELEFALHGAGPAADWAAKAPLGQWVGIAGPRGSMVVSSSLDWHWLLGDESAMPAIERRLAELPASAKAVVRVQLGQAHDRREWRTAAALDLQWVDDLVQAAEGLQLPAGDGFIWAAGENSAMATLRRAIMAKPGVDARRMRIASYWKPGAADHHEELTGD